jgi:chromosomal replication initiation ATPase DnaA
MTELRKLERRTAWEDVVCAVEAVKGDAWAEFRDRHGDWGRDLALYLARRHCGLTLAELGARAGGLRYAAVGQAIRSFERKLKRGDLRAEVDAAECRLAENL